MSTELRPNVSDYPINSLNKTNTYEDSGIVEFSVGSIRFALGFWGTPYQDKSHPYLCLISWTPEGWVVVGKLSPLWNDELNMHMGNSEEDLKTYAWYIGNTFTPLMQEYAEESGEGTIPLTNWEKTRQALNSVKLVNGKIVVTYE